MTEPTIFDCGHQSNCWCSQCHLCEDVTQDDSDETEGGE